LEELAVPGSGLEYMTNVGVVGILVLMILDRVFAFVRTRSPDRHDRLERIGVLVAQAKDHDDAVASKITDLWDWHNLRDEDGVPVWYVRKSLEEAIRMQAESMSKLAENIGEQTRALERLVERQGP